MQVFSGEIGKGWERQKPRQRLASDQVLGRVLSPAGELLSEGHTSELLCPEEKSWAFIFPCQSLAGEGRGACRCELAGTLALCSCCPAVPELKSP